MGHFPKPWGGTGPHRQNIAAPSAAIMGEWMGN